MEEFKIMLPKHPNEEGFVEIDISKWLGTDTIKSVTFTAKNFKTGADATAAVIDNTLSTFSGVYVKPYIKSGVDKTSYKLLALVACNEVEDIGAFTVAFDVKQH